MAQRDYDLFVIGAGSGGVRAARMAARRGAKVAIAEQSRVGGTCVIRGCVPKKLFVYASQFHECFEDAAGFGWEIERAVFDWPTLKANKDREIARLEGLYAANLQGSGVELIHGRAVVRGPHDVAVEGWGEARARVILIAAGGRPNPHRDLPGHELALVSDDMFELEELPARVAVVGAGYIGVEFAGILHGLGVETAIVYRGRDILSGFDHTLRRALHEIYERKGIRIRCCTMFKRLERAGTAIRAELMDGGTLEVDAVLLAVGRIPNTAGLGLAEAGVKLTPRGAVVVDDYSCTSVPSIYAVGDVTDRMALTPVAIREGAAFAETVFNDRPTKVDYGLIPTAVFSQPEIGAVGLTEEAARARLRAVDIYETTFRPMKNTLSGRSERMVMKLVVDADSDRVVGAHVLGPDAGEMAQILAVAMQAGAAKADFDATMALHPTAAEELVTLREKSATYVREAAE